ncbi:hypothetical protein ABZ400_34450 [Streptomyces sp. NPDC005897]|uniref:hypothetical protein n=1 Tax=Streptomyces sp. NPDC005897 TaxID=3157081 RepID=UPI0034111E62
MKLGAVPVALGTSEEPDHDLRLILRLTRSDIGKNVVVMPGDDPSLVVLEVDHPKVSCRRSGISRTELLQEVGRLYGELPFRSGQHDTSAMLEQHPRLARVGEKPLPDVYQYLGLHAGHHAAEHRYRVMIDRRLRRIRDI